VRPLIRCVAVLLVLVCAGSARAASTHAIAQEVSRTAQLDRRVVSFWWLPIEYWEAAAREIGWKDDRIAELRERLGVYAVIAVVDASITPEQRFSFAEIPAIAENLTLRIRGESLAPLRKLDPEVMRPLADLSYLLRASLAGLGNGMRLLLFPNVGPDGKQRVQGASDGSVQLRYAVAGKEPLDFHWHGPLTAVAGGRRDPKTGEPVEASWRFNPWTGEKLP
jgi:hypothetical protein